MSSTTSGGGVTKSFNTHCGWVQFTVVVDYMAPCCGNDQPPPGPIVTYNCNPKPQKHGCDESQFDTGTGGGGFSPNRKTSAVNPARFPRAHPNVTKGVRGFDFTLSSYGVNIPIVFGSDKLTGNVIWASRITDHIFDNNGQLEIYKSLDFALGVCEGEISGVLRMWVGDRLIFDNTVNVDDNGIIQPNDDGFVMGFQTDLTDEDSPLQNLDASVRQTKISVLSGSEFQLPEGPIVANEGYENTPAYRGLAYIIFENFLVADASVPALYVEVSANVTSLWPRQYADLVDTTFDQVRHSILEYDPFYDRVYILARVDPTTTDGLVVFDGNTFEEMAQQVYEHSNAWDNICTTLHGFVVNTMNDGNQGIVRVLNPFTGTELSRIGPGGSITGHSLTTGFGALQTGSVTFSGFDESRLLIDVFAGISVLFGSIGFASVDKNGQLEMLSVLNGTLPAANSLCHPVIITDDLAEVQPTFSDGFPSKGTHVFGLSWANGEDEKFTFWRVTVDGNGATLTAPIYAELSELSFTAFAGTGFTHTANRMMVDKDGCLVFFVFPVSASGRDPRLVKWSPFTGELVWNVTVKPLTTSNESNSGGTWAELTGQTYAWIDSNSRIWQVDLRSGEVTQVLAALADQQLPANIHAHQFYNGYENSITYFSAISGQQLTKVFLNRLTRAQAAVSTIVTNLIERTGLQRADIEINDLSALTLDGYTISTRKSIRACFSELQQVFTYDLVESSGKIKYRVRGSNPDMTISHKYLEGDGDGNWLLRTSENDAARNRKINLTYRNLDREYDTDVANISLDRINPQPLDSEAPIDVTVPIVLEPTTAKKLAEILLYAKLVYNTTYEFALPPRYQHVDPSDVLRITLPDSSSIDMRVRKATIGADRKVMIEASAEDKDIYADQVNLFGNVGRFNGDDFPSLVPRVDVLTLDIGGRSDAEFAATTSAYRMYLTFLNSRPGVQMSEPLTLNLMESDSTLATVLIDPPADYPTWGYVIDPPPFVQSQFTFDEENTVRVKLINTSGAPIASASGGLADLIASKQCNLAYIAGELFQFATATDEGNNVWALTGLLRGRFGTNFSIGDAVAGDRFVLLGDNEGVLDETGVVVVSVPLGQGPLKAHQIFLNTNNPFQPTLAETVALRNLQPWTVADMRLEYDGDDAVIAWARRTRYGGEWPADGDATVPINETLERYGVWLFKDPTIFNPRNPALYLRKVDATSPTFTYTLAMQTADGFDNTADTLFVMVSQIGSHDADVSVGQVQKLDPLV